MAAVTPRWFQDARFGLFVHYGPYSSARLEPSWPMVGGVPVFRFGQSMTVGEYDAATARFEPAKGAPNEWARLAAASRADYAVLTTKHHDGFTLWPSEHSAHGIHKTATGHDVVGEYVEAMRSNGIRVGLYFSLSDWHHPDYPAFTDEMRPYPAWKYPRPEPEQWERFLGDQRGQLDELLTRYGQIDVLWFDGGWERRPEEWRASELEAFIRERQPDIAINDRCPGLPGYSTQWENTVPLDPPPGPWESCLPLDDSWGALEVDAGRKSVGEIVALLCDAAAGGGRLLANLSPLGDGSVLAWQAERLEGLARWSAANHRAIAAEPAPQLSGRRHYGPATQKDGSVFLMCPAVSSGTVVLRAVHGKRIERATVLEGGADVPFRLRTAAVELMSNRADPIGDVVFELPPPSSGPTAATVIELRVSGELA